MCCGSDCSRQFNDSLDTDIDAAGDRCVCCRIVLHFAAILTNGRLRIRYSHLFVGIKRSQKSIRRDVKLSASSFPLMAQPRGVMQYPCKATRGVADIKAYLIKESPSRIVDADTELDNVDTSRGNDVCSDSISIHSTLSYGM